MDFKYSFVLLFLFFVPVDLYVLYLKIKNKKKILNNYGNAETIEKEISNLSYKKVYIKWALLTLAGILLTIALAGPVKMGAEIKKKQKTIDVIFLVDISKSMLAQDEEPSRLEKAKSEIKQIINNFQENSFSLILFSNNAFVFCPTTMDTNTLLEFVNEISVGLSSQTGTSFQPAFETIKKSLINSKEKEKAIVLLSDGETHSPYEDKDLEWFINNKIKVYTIALGSDNGAKIPIIENNIIGYKKDSSGKEIITKRNTTLLNKISSKTNAITIENEKQIPQLIAELNKLQRTEKETKQKVIKEELYYYFLWPAILLLLLELIILERKDVFI